MEPLIELTLETSTFLDIKFDDISATKGTPFVSGILSNSTPEIIVFRIVSCTQEYDLEIYVERSIEGSSLSL